jgi:3-dehydroquinate synthase
MNRVQVSLQERSYDVLIGSNILPELNCLVQEVLSASQFFFVLDANVEATHGEIAMDSFACKTDHYALEAVESNKIADTIDSIWSSMLNQGCDRGTVVVSIGGGLTGDVGGFAAATYLRGVPLIQVPTTLLAMVDASVGGKTGINLPTKRPDGTTILGKNLAGSFWQPRLVVADVSALQTLDDRQLRCGLAECVKHAMLGHPEVISFIQENHDGIFNRDEEVLIELVTQSVAIKAEVVAKDEREAGSRALLNLGHTFAHAIEPMKELGLFHGEAVSIGLCAACSCSEALGMIDADFVDQIRALLVSIGLPTRLPMPIQLEDAMGLMQKDKKVIDSCNRLVLPSKDGAMIVDDVDKNAILLAWASVGVTSS